MAIWTGYTGVGGEVNAHLADQSRPSQLGMVPPARIRLKVSGMKWVEVIETLVIFVAIGSIWLLTLGYISPLTIGFCVAVIAGL